MKRLRTWLSWLGLATASVGGGGATPAAEPKLIATPDAPVSFGYKVSWFAIRTLDVSSVIAALQLEDRKPANWRSGIEAAYSHDDPGSTESRVFVSPPLEGWILVVGSGLPVPDQRDPKAQGGAPVDPRFDRIFGRLAGLFPDVQFFSSNRVVGLAAWARARAGRIERVFCYADGEVYANVGVQSAEERARHFLDLSGLLPLQAREAIFRQADRENAHADHSAPTQRSAIPDEEDVLAVADAWSLNPASFDQRQVEPGVGSVARFRAVL